MRQTFIAAFLGAAATATHASAGTLIDAGFDEAHGIVESVREGTLRKHPAWLTDVFEHAINPETGQEVFVRLSDERAIAVVQEGPRRFQPGQRVLVVRDVNGTRIEGV